MSETKLEVKSRAHSENFHYHSENFHYHSENSALQKFRNVCEIFAMSNSEIFLIFLIFFLKNKIE